jgi:ABC-type branched-subunit amino acid transport system ATPase component
VKRLGSLNIEGVSKRFGGLLAVKHCSFDVAPGSLMGLIGPNGAGKSTVFNLISGLYRPESGSILFDGEQIVGRRPDEIAAMGLGRTFQTPRSFATLTCRENLLTSVPSPGERLAPAILGAYRSHEREISTEATHFLEQVGLANRAEDPADALSGGELRMLEIGRQLMRDPDVLLLDEPTAGVTSALQVRLAEMLRALHSQGLTVIVVEHNLGFLLNLVDHVVVMVKGSVLTQGDPDEIRSNAEVINAYLGRRDDNAP